MADYIPQSNVTLNNGLPSWQGNVPLPYDTNEVLAKIDHQVNDAHRITGSYFTTAGVTTVFPGNGNIAWATQDYEWRQHNLNLSDVWIMGPDKMNQVWNRSPAEISADA